MIILGIETSCDETSAAVVADGRIVLSSVVSSQFDLHADHGGVVPELAARRHVTAIVPVIERAITDAGIERSDIDVIAVTQGPGLAGSLVVGMNAAKAMAYALRRPLVTVNHLEAHIYANWLEQRGEPYAPPAFPLLCLVVSGGHTELILMPGHGDYQRLGQTLDDAAGEAFDKGARLLGLGFPGGPAIEAEANSGNSAAYLLPRAWLPGTYDFSFSGLKTALLRATEPHRLPDAERDDRATFPSNQTGPFRSHRAPRFAAEAPITDLAASFQEAIVEPLAVKTAAAAREHQPATIALAGGVSANSALRQRLTAEIMAQYQPDATIAFPELRYCTDNAAMVAGAASWVIRRGDQAGWEADIFPRLALTGNAR